MGKKQTHTITLGIIRGVDDTILVTEAWDPATGEAFYRPVGGHIEFGELAAKSLVREFEEELGVAVERPRFLGAIEAVYTYDARSGHEIVLVFEVSFVDAGLMARESFRRIDVKDRERWATWQSLTTFERGEAVLYPVGLLEVVKDARVVHQAADTRLLAK